jgi:rhodanese-related sulfurtransferase
MSEQHDILVVDTRSKEEYAEEGTVPGAWYIGADGGFAPWVGALITNINQKIIFIAEGGREHEVVTRFSRVGYDNTLGFLRGGMHAWLAAGFETDKIGSISATQFANQLNDGSIGIALDVRKESEFLSEHVVGVENFPLDNIHANFAEIKPNQTYVLHCASGYRSLIAASIFKANGVKNVIDVRGGFKDIKDTGAKLTDYVCPTTLL